VKTLRRPLRAAWLAVALLAVAGCGGGSSSSTGSSGSQTASDFDFGDNNPRKVTAFGDSITAGVLELQRRGAKLSTSNNYPNQLQARLRGLDPAWTVVNRGVGGEDSGQGLRRFQGVLNLDKPGFVLIMEGTNDASDCADAPAIINNLRNMIHIAKGSKVIPILGSIPPNFRNDPCAQDVAFKISVLAPGLAESESVVFADVYNGMNDRSLFGLALSRDPLHPNEHGYSVLADIWYQAMLKAVPGGATAALRRRR
jgi:lysophospholipase L1-like esterase